MFEYHYILFAEKVDRLCKPYFGKKIQRLSALYERKQIFYLFFLAASAASAASILSVVEIAHFLT